MIVKNILFDLDGTLTDPKTGITRSIQFALNKLGNPIPEPEELLWCIGPPLLESFEKILGPDNTSLAKEALFYYRERFSRIGKLENQIYSGIPEILYSLNQLGLSLFVATSKPCVYAREIIGHLDLTTYFRKIYGSKLNGNFTDKGELIAHIMEEEGLSPDDTVMVGDRKYDIAAAKNNNIKSLGVTYGFGSKEELIKAGADFLAEKPSEIKEIISQLDIGQAV